jgi:maltose O-acetyltransferase
MRQLLRRWLKRWRTSRVEQLRALGAVIGRDVSLQPGVVIDESHAWHITIGDEVTIAPGVIVLAHDASTKRPLGYTRIGLVHIGHRVFIGAGSVVMPGVRIGDDAIVGAGSVVTGDIEAGCVVAGNPARVVMTTHDYLAKRRAQLEAGPRFDATYTRGGGVTPARQQEMNAAMHDRFGFIE